MNKYMMSIITVVYNNRKDIERVITSVLNQTYDNIEYIIIDGGSTDGTVDIIKKYSDSNIKWISEPDKGIYDALNKGIAMATGDYIYVIGSDDYLYDNEVIRKVVNCLNEEVDIFSSGIIVIDKDGTMKYAGNEGVRDRFKYDGSYMIPHPGLFVRSSLQKKRLYDTTLQIAADYKFFLSCYYDAKIRFKYESFPVAYFSNMGISGTQEETLIAERMKIWQDFGMSHCIEKERKKRAKVHNKIKRYLKKHNMYEIFNLHIHKR